MHRENLSSSLLGSKYANPVSILFFALHKGFFEFPIYKILSTIRQGQSGIIVS